MKILPEYNFEYDIIDLSSPVIPQYAWFYDVTLNDFLMRPITMLEETVGSTVTAKINNEIIKIPASWHVLIVDDDTKTVDTVLITQCANSAFKAFTMHPRLNRFEPVSIQLLDLSSETVVHLSIPKLNMICHPIGKTFSSKGMPMNILLGPQDIGKHMINMSAQELLM